MLPNRRAILGAGLAAATAGARPAAAVAAGATILEVPTAVDVSRLEVSSSVAMVRTGGHHLPGLGGALYVRAEGEDVLPSLTSANGVRFRLCDDELRALRPEVLGAEGNAAVVLDPGAAPRMTGADDSDAVGAAVRVAMGLNGCVVLSARRYRLCKPLPPITSAMALVGAGALRTWLMFDPEAQGDAISVVETWLGNDPTEVGAGARLVTIPEGQSSGVALQGFTLSASRRAPGPQNGIVLYERNDNLLVTDVEVRNFAGRGFASGLSRKPRPTSLLRESRIDRLQVRACGNRARDLPAFELSSDGYRPADDATNNLCITDLLVIYSDGRGAVIENRNRFQDIRYVSITGLYAEGAVGDLVTIRGSVTNLELSAIELNGCRSAGSAALRFSAAGEDASQRPPRSCFVSGAIGPVLNGVAIDQGKDLRFRLTQNSARGVHVQVGSGCSGAVRFDGGGNERNWRVDAAATAQRFLTIDPGRRDWHVRELPEPGVFCNALLTARGLGTNPALVRSDGTRWHYVAMAPVPPQAD